MVCLDSNLGAGPVASAGEGVGASKKEKSTDAHGSCTLVEAGCIEGLSGCDQVLVVGGADTEEMLGGGGCDQVSVKLLFNGEDKIGWGERSENAVADGAGDGGGSAVD